MLRTACFLSCMCVAICVEAGGGMVLRDDICIVQIGFYEAHFTAYQPVSHGDEEFCQALPTIGETLFVLDYLHASLREVPVDFRIIHNTTELGRYIRLSDVDDLGDLAPLTVHYQAAIVQSNASLKVNYDFLEAGQYVGIVTAGHPTNEKIYRAAFPFQVGVFALNNYLGIACAVIGVVIALIFFRRRTTRPQHSAAH